MFENLVDVMVNDSVHLLIYATCQSIDQEISPSITNVLIHHLIHFDLIENRLKIPKDFPWLFGISLPI